MRPVHEGVDGGIAMQEANDLAITGRGNGVVEELHCGASHELNVAAHPNTSGVDAWLREGREVEGVVSDGDV